MKKLATYFVAGVALIGAPALAADMAVKAPPPAPAPEVPSWTGFYIGIDAGGAWWSEKESWIPTPTGIIDPANLGSTHQVGAVGGFLAGYNWQFSPAWVVGIEGDFNWASLSTTTMSGLTLHGVPVPQVTLLA